MATKAMRKTVDNGTGRSKSKVQFVPENEDSGSDSERSAIMGKDQDEEDLDRLVLGDSGGFLESLEAQMDVDEDNEHSEDNGEAELEANIGLEGVDDADVRTWLRF
jgi:hypothetical protein